MRTLTFLLLNLLAVVLLLMSGCSSSDNNPSGPGTNDPVLAAERVNQANQIMMPRMAALFSNQAVDTSLFNMSAAISLYREALTYDNTNKKAHFGLALSELIHLGSDHDVLSLIQAGANLLPAIARGPMFLSGQYATGVKDGISRSVLPFAEGWNPMVPFASFGGGLIPLASAGHAPSYYQDLLEIKVLPVTTDIIVHLTTVAQDPNFAFYITSSMVGTELQDSVRIDLMEVYIVLAAVRGLASECSFAVSYTIDYPDTNAAALAQAWTLSAPFLQLRPNGVQRMKDTKSQLLAMATTIQSAIDFLIHQTPHPGVQLIPYRPQDLPQLNQAVAAMDSLKHYFSSTIQAGGVALNIGSLFDNPITNFKQKIPAYTVDHTTLQPDGTYSVVLRWQALSFSTWYFPDPTFNGLFPGMTDASLKQQLGLTAGNWTQTVLIGG